VPIFSSVDGQLRALRRVRPGADLYEREIEALIWSNIEAFYGTDLFPIARQGAISSGGRPDLIALDESGRIVVFEVKRAIDRSQLAQCLEYAGWARGTNLDELSALYHRGSDSFFADWLEFTGGSTPVIVNPAPILVLVAQDFDSRTSDALGFLASSGVPVFTVPIGVYEDDKGRRMYQIDSEFEDSIVTEPERPSRRQVTTYKFNGRRLAVADLLDAGFLEEGEVIEYHRQKEGKVFRASLTAEGRILTEDGTVFDSLSRAACTLAGIGALPGWEVWVAPSRGGKRLMDLRDEFLATLEQSVTD
jgi:hypothetical protein